MNWEEATEPVTAITMAVDKGAIRRLSVRRLCVRRLCFGAVMVYIDISVCWDRTPQVR